MRSLLILLVFVLNFQLYSQTQTVDSKVVSAIVYNSGAQVTSEKKISLNQGLHTLVFDNLSPNIDESSIIVTGLENINLNFIAFETDFLNEKESSIALDKLKNQLKDFEKKKVYTGNKIKSLEKSIALLENNQSLDGGENELNVEKIKAYKDYYSSQIESISNSIYDQQLLLKAHNEDILKLTNEIKKLESKNRINRGKIRVELEVENSGNRTLSLSYFIFDAGWYAAYDLKTEDSDENITLTYKAKVYQSSGEDWENINLKLSTAKPNSNTVKPELEPYYLDYNSPVQQKRQSYRYQNLRYNPSVKSVLGKVFDQQGLPLPGVNVLIGNKGTQTDFDGNYSIDVGNSQTITYSYLGFESVSIPVYNSNININLETDSASLDEVVIMGYGNARKKKSAGDIQEVAQAIQQQTSVEFQLPQPISLVSSFDDKQFQLNEHELETTYEYYSAPELSSSVFLIARLKDWQDLDLIEGTANLYFANSYLGITSLNLGFLEENLSISLGADEKIVLERTLPRKKTSQTFFGNTRIIDKAYEIEVKNTKNSVVDILIQERVPISRDESIEVEDVTYSKAEYNSKTGYITWKVQLQPNEKTTLSYSYTLKYPKNRVLNLRP
jgi:hypothetical protein